MNPQFQKTRQQQEQEQVQNSSTSEQAKTFASVEEMLRKDSADNPVPPEVGERLNQSIASESKPQSSWWKKLFSK